MIRFKDYCEDISEKEYRAAEGLSYSYLKELDDIGPSLIRDGSRFKAGPGLTLGSIVDGLLTDPDYEPLDHYTLSNIRLDLSGATHTSTLLNHIKDKSIMVIEGYDFTEMFEELGFKRPPKLTDFFWQQVGLLNSEKPILHQSEYELALRMVETFKYHNYTKDIFNPDLDIEVIDQAIIKFKINNTQCKSMLDRVHIDHTNKVIYPMDIKTGSPKEFIDNFWNFKYYLQGGMYTMAVHSIVQTKEEFKDYKVAPFEFIYVSRVNPNLPLIYKMTDKFVQMAIEGWTGIGGREMKGVLDLVSDYKWYVDNNEFNLRRDIVENNGVIDILAPMTKG